MSGDSVLPPSVAVDQRFVLLERLWALRLGQMPLAVVLVNLVDQVAGSALPWLGEQFSLLGDGWEMAASDAERRALLHAALEIHRHKGTPWAISRMLELLGLLGAQLVEHAQYAVHDATVIRNGQSRYASDRWWEYELRVQQPLSIRQGVLVRAAMAEVAPARAVLSRIVMGALRHDGAVRRDGQYSYGVV